MHKLKSKLTVFFAGAALLGTIATVGAAPLGSQFTYQGRISDGGSPLNGIYEVSATLWDAASAGALLGSNAVSVTISNGLLTLPLDFGTNVFNGDARWLGIGVRTNGSAAAYTVLAPRQAIQPTPYSITALNVNAAGISGGTVPDTRLSANVARRDQANNLSGNQIITNGSLSVGAANPTFPVVVKSGNTAGIYSRLLQFQSDSGSPQWEFFLTSSNLDVTESGVAGNRLFLQKGGNVGIGTATPTAKLEVNGQVKATAFLGTVGATNLSGSIPDARLSANVARRDQVNFFTGDLYVTNAALYAEVVRGIGPTLNIDANAIRFTGDNNVGVRLAAYGANGSTDVELGADNPLSDTVTLWNFGRNAHMELSCLALNIISDHNAKEEFKPVNARDVLAKVASLPITEWQYKQKGAHADATRHIGPMAQDFHAAFGMGRDDKHITSVDADGVALAAIQGLNEKVDEKDARIQELENSVAELKEFVRKLSQGKEGGR